MTPSSRPDQPTAPILSVAVNPALDVSMAIDHLIADQKLRADDCVREAGGGGVNVSRALRRLGVASTSFVVAGGPIGSELVSRMVAGGLDVSLFEIAGTTRESVAITELSTGRQYRISVPGPTVDDVDALHRRIVDQAAGAQIVILSGSVAPDIPADFYAQVIADLDSTTTTIVDAHGPWLAAVTAHTATLVKPSQRELAELVGWEPITAAEVERAAAEILARGAVEAVVASRGPSGAVLVSQNEAPVWFRPPPVHPRSTVGAGDSMVAGIAASLARGLSLEEAVRFGVAAGTAAVLTPGSALCEADDVERFLDQVSIVTYGSDAVG